MFQLDIPVACLFRLLHRNNRFPGLTIAQGCQKVNMFDYALTQRRRKPTRRGAIPMSDESLAAGKKSALVTGGSSGIGRSAVLALARAGYNVAINYSSSETPARETAAEAEALGARTLLLKCDVSDENGVRAMMQSIEANFGRLDVLINNAGTTAPWKPKDLESLSLDDWDRVFNVNVRGLFQVTRAAVPLLRKGEKPCIINTASIVGLRPGPQPLPYAASKAAVVNMTKTLAWNLGPEIRVNAVAPGWMEGDWMQRMLKDKYEDLMARRAKATPLKRCVTADDVAETMMSLVQGNRFVTGEIVVIDGGFTAST